MNATKAILMTLAILLGGASAQAQVVTTPNEEVMVMNEDSVRKSYDERPYFGLYKDNYFTIGTCIGDKPDSHNSDVKFQVSISQRLTKSTLPFNTYLFLFYSQKCMWNVFEESLPMRDLNFNPGIGLSKVLISKNRIVGKVTAMIEHESNGRDSLDSRSWNKFSICGSIFITPQFMIHGKWWLALIDGKHNKDILRYSGIYQTGMQFVTDNKRWVFDATFIKRKGWNLSGNWSVDVGFRLRKKDNQFLMLHYYNGYGENLLDYNKYHSRLRIGLLIRPHLFSDF